MAGAPIDAHDGVLEGCVTMIGPPQYWDDDERFVYVRVRYTADKRGADAAEEYERIMTPKGLMPYDVQFVGGGTDVGRSIAKSAIGLGLLAATGFGFAGTSRRKAEIVVTYRSYDFQLAEIERVLAEQQSRTSAAIVERSSSPHEQPVSAEQVASTKRLRRALRAAQLPGRCPRHQDREAQRFTVEYPGRKPKKVWLCLECAQTSAGLGATLRSPEL